MLPDRSQRKGLRPGPRDFVPGSLATVLADLGTVAKMPGTRGWGGSGPALQRPTSGASCTPHRAAKADTCCEPGPARGEQQPAPGLAWTLKKKVRAQGGLGRSGGMGRWRGAPPAPHFRGPPNHFPYPPRAAEAALGPHSVFLDSLASGSPSEQKKPKEAMHMNEKSQTPQPQQKNS